MTENTIDLDDSAPGVSWATPDALEDSAGPGPLFDDDTGTLPIEVRRTMVSLLKKRYISAE